MLFDVDGTLLSAGGVSSRALLAALRECFGTEVSGEGYEYSGKTDPQIVRELMRGAGLAEHQIDLGLVRALEIYRQRLLAWLRPADVVAKPGVLALLEALSAGPRASLGLLTGNLEPCARAKLEPLGANRFFRFGAFGSDHEDRYRLPALALERARAALGISFAGEDMVIVGDSIHDVLCGRGLGARAVAVATGRTPIERLAALGPDAALADLSDTPRALAAILAREA